MSLQLENDVMEQEIRDKRITLGRGMWDRPAPRVVTVEGIAEFVPGPADQGGKLVIFQTDRKRHWIAAKSFSEVMAIALRATGFEPHQFFDHHANVNVTVWLTVDSTTDMEVEVKSVVIFANHGGGSATYAIEGKDNRPLYCELSEELEQEARLLAGH